jgi:hypothetical protein
MREQEGDSGTLAAGVPEALRKPRNEAGPGKMRIERLLKLEEFIIFSSR